MQSHLPGHSHKLQNTEDDSQALSVPLRKTREHLTQRIFTKEQKLFLKTFNSNSAHPEHSTKG